MSGRFYIIAYKMLYEKLIDINSYTDLKLVNFL